MSYADLPPGACYVPELHLEPYWVIDYDGQRLLLNDEAFLRFADEVKYEGVEYTARRVERTPEYYRSLPEAAM